MCVFLFFSGFFVVVFLLLLLVIYTGSFAHCIFECRHMFDIPISGELWRIQNDVIVVLLKEFTSSRKRDPTRTKQLSRIVRSVCLKIVLEHFKRNNNYNAFTG